MSKFNLKTINGTKAMKSDVSPDKRRSLTDANNPATRSSNAVPGLLVSVRSADEAILAFSGGIEILDVKEPSLGSLGMASLQEINAISQLEELTSQEIPLSVALGELNNWTQESTIPSLPAGISFAKLGLQGCAVDPQWSSHWQRVKSEFGRRAKSNVQWVAVAYADSVEAASPPVHEILNAAIASGCAGLLIDTWAKGGRTLLDFKCVAELIKMADTCHASGLFFALAGKLNRQLLAELANIPADVLAIRSAACRGSDRTVELEPTRIREFRIQIRHCFEQR